MAHVIERVIKSQLFFPRTHKKKTYPNKINLIRKKNINCQKRKIFGQKPCWGHKNTKVLGRVRRLPLVLELTYTNVATKRGYIEQYNILLYYLFLLILGLVYAV